jgi:hypothetical protein
MSMLKKLRNLKPRFFLFIWLACPAVAVAGYFLGKLLP